MEIIQEEVAPKGVKKRRFTLFRASLVCFVVFTLLCGLAYPLSVTLAAQTAFPYEANGSQIIVTMPDGAKTVYGSELIGQSYESADYFGRERGRSAYFDRGGVFPNPRRDGRPQRESRGRGENFRGGGEGNDRPIYRGPFFMDFRGKTGKRPAGQSFFGRVNLTCKRAN